MFEQDPVVAKNDILRPVIKGGREHLPLHSNAFKSEWLRNQQGLLICCN